VALAVIATASASIGSPALPSRIPLADRIKLQHLTDAAVLSTRFEAPPFPARRDVFEYLLDHPEFATHVTRGLRFARYKVWRTADGLYLDDGWGAKGRFDIVHAGPGIRVIHTRGIFEQRLLPDVRGEAVVVIEWASPNRGQLATAVSAYLKIDNAALALASRVSSAVANDKAELEARRLVRVFSRTLRAIDENPAAVYQMLRQRPDVPAADLDGFRRLLGLP
jgi:hypothetical protein